MIRQCPLCPLRFDLAPMLADHLATDHGVAENETDHLQPPSRRTGRTPPPPPPRDDVSDGSDDEE